MHTVEKYVCDICSHEYSMPSEALACEGLVTSDRFGGPEYEVGKTINFHLETHYGVYCYTWVDGLILHKTTLLRDNPRRHETMLIVKVADCYGKECERGVLWAKGRCDDKLELWSPMEFDWYLGKAESLKAQGH